MMTAWHRMATGTGALMILCLALAGPAAAQSEAPPSPELAGGAIVGDRPFYPVTATIPSGRPGAAGDGTSDAATSGYVFEFLAAPDGDVAGLGGYAVQDGRRVGLCEPIPVRLAGPPPRTIYLFPCGPGGGAGGGGTLSVESLVVEFNLDATDPASGAPVPFGITVQEILDGGVAGALQLSIPLPEGPAAQ
ncbi:hypothetical protein HKCCSP123_03345 [Rhodobacterales bacterium HKCCSP123]|nr:hypothetical protein [Rhodobacterales bacterium HKCCSP123]